MAVYRYQIVSVGLWRGEIKRWNTTLHYATSTAALSIRGAFQKLGYPNPGDVVGNCSGGVASISVYNASGGAPVDVETFFDWTQQSTWIPYDGTVWSSVPTGTPVDASGESAALLVGHMPGLSSSGKPITTRKYLHAIPSRTAAAITDPDISATDQAAISAVFSTAYLGNAAGVIPTSISTEPYYFNHQRVRGRRRTTKQVAAQSFSAGVVAGSGASASGDQPFQ